MHSLFTVAGDVARLVHVRPFADLYTEKRIQDWSDLNPAVINGGQPMISLGTEVRTAHGHYIDNLFIDGDGVLVAAEMKQGRSRRDVVSQMLDYAAFVSRLTWDEIDRFCKARQSADLADLFARTFRRNLRKNDKPAHRLVIVAESFEETTLDQALYLINDRTTPLVLIEFKYLEVDGQSLIYVEPVLGVIPNQGRVTAPTSEVQPDDGYAAWLLPAIGEKLGEISEAQGWPLRHSVNKQSVTFNSAVWPVALGDCQFRIDLYRRAAVSCRFFCRLGETRGLKEMLEARRTDWQKLFPATEQRPTAALPYLTLTLHLTRPGIGNQSQLNEVFDAIARMTDALHPLVDSYFHAKAVTADTRGGVDACSINLKDGDSIGGSSMPTSGELFYVDDDGEKHDADLHEAILAGDHPDAMAAGRRMAVKIGLPKDVIEKIYGPQPRGTYVGTFPYVKETPQYHVVQDRNGNNKWFEKSKHIITQLPDGKVDVHEKPLGSPAAGSQSVNS